MATASCADCGVVFLLQMRRQYRRSQVLRCPPCKEKRHAQQKLDSQRKRNESRRRNEMHDISSDEIEQRFQAALKQARRESNSTEPFRSYDFLYREPRG